MSAQVAESIRIIDMDSHYTEPADLWTSRAPARFKDLVPHVVAKEDGEFRWIVGGDIELGPLGYTVVRANGSKINAAFSLPSYQEMHRAAYELPARLNFLDETGIYAQLMYPNVAGFGSNKFMLVQDEELRRVCVRLYNDAAAELQAASGGRLFPQAAVPFWNIEDTVAELRRVKLDLGLTGIVMCDAPESFGLRTLDAPSWEPFWATCEELDLPVNFHLGSGSLAKPQPWETMSMQARGGTMTIVDFLNNARAIMNVIFTGIVVRHPRLKIVSVESGVGWIPFLIEAMEYQFDEVIPEDEKRLWGGMRPRDLFRRNIYCSFWFEHAGPTHLVEQVGEDNIMFETDFPHPTCLYPHAIDRVTPVLKDLPERVRRKILHDNAAYVYSLPV